MRYKILKASRIIDEYDDKSKIDASEYLNFSNGIGCFPISRRKNIQLELHFDDEMNKIGFEDPLYGTVRYVFVGYDNIEKKGYIVDMHVNGDDRTIIYVTEPDTEKSLEYIVEGHVNPEHFIKGFDLKKYVLENFDAIFRPELVH